MQNYDKEVWVENFDLYSKSERGMKRLKYQEHNGEIDKNGKFIVIYFK